MTFVAISSATQQGAELPAPNWHITAAAQRVFASLTAGDVHLRAHTPAVGPRYFAWSAGDKHQQLSAIRTAAVERAFGCSFQQANMDGRAREYLAADAQVIGIEEALAERFGNPAQFGACPSSSLSETGDAARKAEAHIAASIAAYAQDLAA